MKQCPNPNCILYTRLEELPDAYVKCPGCGGQLVDANLLSGKLRSGYLTKHPSGGLADRDLDEEFQAAFPEEHVAQPAAPGAQNVQYDDEYYPYEDTEQDESASLPAAGISRGGRAAYVFGMVLLLVACVLTVYVLTTRFIAPAAVPSASATETALTALLPAVNTPVPVMPTVPQSELPPPTPTLMLPPAEPPTQPPNEPTAQPTTAAQQDPPTVAVAPTAPSQPAAPTAPPAQPEPVAGVSSAQMVLSLDGGQPAGNVSAYRQNDPFVLAVQAQFGPGGVTSMRTRWYGPDGGLLYELPREFSQQGTYYTGFTLKKDSPWAVGDYRVDIHTNNSPSPAYSVTFSVVP
ncbi:MAG: hypothetical protein ABI670_13290 [Chloroflexota bacterium]